MADKISQEKEVIYVYKYMEDKMETAWLPDLLETIRLVGVALITALVSIAVVWQQNKIKLTELDTNVKFKAREHMYLAYEKDLRSSHESFSKLYGALGEMMGTGMGLGEELSVDYWKAIRVFFKSAMHDQKIVDYYKKELEELGLLDDDKKEMLKNIETTLNKDATKIPDKDMPEYIGNFLNISQNMASLDTELLEKKRDEWFSPFIN